MSDDATDLIDKTHPFGENASFREGDDYQVVWKTWLAERAKSPKPLHSDTI
jgi:hypothetical protein